MNEKFLYNSVIKKDNDYTVWIGFPGEYKLAMSSLGFLWMFKIIDEIEDVNAERIYSDSDKTLFNNPNIFGFSFSFDFHFLEIFKMLEKYNIPLKADDRNDTHPLIFAGGPVVSANPMPYNEIFDFFIIGDGEELNLEVIRLCKECKDIPKNSLLEKLSNIEGVYVPKYPKDVTKRTKRLEQCIYTPILTDKAYFSDTFIIELSRGCTNRCGFCLASYINFPYRSVPDNSLFEVIEMGLKYTNKIAFLGAEVSAHPKFEEICEYIYKKIKNGNKIEMNFSSLRVDAITPKVVKTLVSSGQKSITLAIEAGSERLRKFINKNLNEKQILDAINIAKINGLKSIKLYGMIGIPTETDEDIKELIEIAKKIKIQNKGIEITFAFSSFVPKAHTPFQWFGRDNSKNLDKKINYLQKEFHKLGVQSSFPSVKWDYWQALLSRGDETISELLIQAYKKGGKLGAFKTSCKELNINSDSFVYENYMFDKILPWDFIKINPGKDFLIKENKRLTEGYTLNT